MNIGIIFGGPSREREISFAGGRTVYDNLNKSIFTPVPIFVDSLRNFILLDWAYIYKGTIRDFYPPVEFLPSSEHDYQIYIESLGKLSSVEQDAIINKVGKRIEITELANHIDFAFLTLHGNFGEDGQIQGLLDSLKIPYTGSGLRACSIGIDKSFQKKMMSSAGFASPEVMIVKKEDFKPSDINTLYNKAIDKVGFPVVIRPANQGSSIGVSIIPEKSGIEGFKDAMMKAFFQKEINASLWNKLSIADKTQFIRELTDIRDGLGFPLEIDNRVIYQPSVLLSFLDKELTSEPTKTLTLESHLSEHKVVIESFIKGQEFSCIVIRKENGDIVALPPTEILKGQEVFDYRSKYLPGLARKLTPINLPDDEIQAIRKECEKLYQFFEFGTYARIDGFFTTDKKIFLNDPNTTSGMLPSSFFFHQAAEIGLNPSEFLSFIIRVSIQERIEESTEKTNYESLLKDLDLKLASLKSSSIVKKKIAVFLGGYSFERHISVESGRNIFEKLASSAKYEPIPIFVTGNDTHHDLYQIPINLLLKDNADDIRDKVLHFKSHGIIDNIKRLCSDITGKYASDSMVFEPVKLSYDELAAKIDAVFIALHGRPGEDGTVQAILDKYDIPYNGSSSISSSVTINKYETLQKLKKEGFLVADQFVLDPDIYKMDPVKAISQLEEQFNYPFIAKPVDDGCSSAVKVIKNNTQLTNYIHGIFRNEEELSSELRTALDLGFKEEFPKKEAILFETLITREGAKHFLEITGGLLTHVKNGKIVYEVFEPSEALATGEILSLEEKFLAGEGQNITPARFAKSKEEYNTIASKVKKDLEKAAKILGVTGYARIDAFVRIYPDNKVQTIIIEVNSLPGMTPATCIFHQSALNGYKPYEFIDSILEYGFQLKNIQQHVS